MDVGLPTDSVARSSRTRSAPDGRGASGSWFDLSMSLYEAARLSAALAAFRPRSRVAMLAVGQRLYALPRDRRRSSRPALVWCRRGCPARSQHQRRRCRLLGEHRRRLPAGASMCGARLWEPVIHPLWRPPLLRSKPTFASGSIMCFSSSEPARPRDDDEQVRGRRRRQVPRPAPSRTASARGRRRTPSCRSRGGTAPCLRMASLVAVSQLVGGRGHMDICAKT